MVLILGGPLPAERPRLSPLFLLMASVHALLIRAGAITLSLLLAAVNPEGRDLNRLVAEGSKLETEVALATEAMKAAITAADNSRQRSQQQVKFLVRLAEPQIPELQYIDWRWKGFLATLGIIVVLWGIGSFVLGVVDRR